MNEIEINKSDRIEIARYLSILGAVRIRDLGTFKVKRYKTKLKNMRTKEIQEYDSLKVHFVPHPKFKALIR